MGTIHVLVSIPRICLFLLWHCWRELKKSAKQEQYDEEALYDEYIEGRRAEMCGQW